MSEEHEEIRRYIRDNDKRIEKLEETIFEIEAVRPLFTTMVNMNEEIAELKDIVNANSLIMKLNKNFLLNQKEVLQEYFKESKEMAKLWNVESHVNYDRYLIMLSGGEKSVDLVRKNGEGKELNRTTNSKPPKKEYCIVCRTYVELPHEHFKETDEKPPEASAMNCKNWDPHATFCFQSKNCDICNEWEPRNEKPPINKIYSQKEVEILLNEAYKQHISEFLEKYEIIYEITAMAPSIRNINKIRKICESEIERWQKEKDEL